MTNILSHAQEFASRFNKAEAVESEFERLHILRRLFKPAQNLPKDVLAELDWRQAHNTCRQTRAVSSLCLP